MAKDTIRDNIWSQALILTQIKGEAVRVGEIAEKVEASEKSVRDCLDTISGTPFLKKDYSQDGEPRYLADQDIGQ